MSDTDEGNVDEGDANEGDADDGGFDKEAERERLREKYERDQQRRQATQRMSELLLKGATMTNQHCESCGSPLFRHDGEVFCPTCQGTREVVGEDDDVGEADAGGTASSESGTADADADEVPGSGEVTGAEEEFAVSEFEPDDRQPADRAEGRRASDDAAGRSPRPAAGSGDDRAAPERPTGARRDRPSTTSTGTDGSPDRQSLLDSSRGPSPHESSVEEAPSLSQAKASLRRAIVSLSEQAAQSDDPGRAHDLLEGSREAAEALAALGGDEE